MPYLVPSDWTTKNIRVKAEPVASATLGLRLAFSCSTRGKRAYVLSALRTPLAHANATARACNQERGLACRALDSAQGKPCSVALLGLAFTMAEILLSLTIIGVVAAITLPSLTGNINERTWNTQRKALYARFSQAIALMPALNGFGTLIEETDSAGSTSIEDTAAETFVTSGLSKVLKINNICDNEHLEDCGIANSWTTMDGDNISVPTTMKDLNQFLVSNSYPGVEFSQINTKAAAFETANGESVLVYYAPGCQPNNNETTEHNSQGKMCANFVFDMNGNKGPNTIGKDIGFLTVFYPIDSKVVAPIPHQRDAGTNIAQEDASAACTAQDPEYRIPNMYEMASLFTNKDLIGNITGSVGYNTSSVLSSTQAWRVGTQSGNFWVGEKSLARYLRCVKRN